MMTIKPPGVVMLTDHKTAGLSWSLCVTVMLVGDLSISSDFTLYNMLK